MHPKARDVYKDLSLDERKREAPLDGAREAADDGGRFFALFRTMVPSSQTFLLRSAAA